MFLDARSVPSGTMIETEVCIVHERIATPASREGHAAGWDGCLEGLAAYVGG